MTFRILSATRLGSIPRFGFFALLMPSLCALLATGAWAAVPSVEAGAGTLTLLARGPLPETVTGEAAWSATPDLAQPFYSATMAAYGLGFVVASGGAITVEDRLVGGAVPRTLLQHQVAYVPPDTFGTRETDADTPVPFHRLELGPAGTPPEPPGTEPPLTGEPFTLPAQGEGAELVALGTTVGAEPVSLALASAAMMLVLSGEVEFGGEVIGAGSAAVAATEEFTIVATGGAGVAQIVLATVLAADDLAAYPVVEEQTGFEFTVSDCPEGVGIARFGGVDGGPLCADVDDQSLSRAEEAAVTVTNADSGYTIAGATNDDGVLFVDGLSPGPYLAGFPDAADVKSICMPWRLAAFRAPLYDVVTEARALEDGHVYGCDVGLSAVPGGGAATPVAGGSSETVAISAAVGICPAGSEIADLGPGEPADAPLCTGAAEPVSVEGVTVLLESFGQFEEITAETDAAGAVSFPSLPPAMYMLVLPASLEDGQDAVSNCLVVDPIGDYTLDALISPIRLEPGMSLTCRVALAPIANTGGEADSTPGA